MAEALFETVGPGRCRVGGEMTFATVSGLLAASLAAFAEPEEHLEVDLSGVMRADSAGLALLIEWLRRARGTGKTIVFRAIPDQLRAIARVSDLEGILPVEAAAV
ncbi:MAG: STAS domain-containing protein [Thiohalomonadaceae bacterium]